MVLIAGFAAVIAVGTVVLMTPLATVSGEWTRPIDALFTATSAVSVTGLVVVDTGTYWSPFGHVVILLLMQIGGFGFMTGSTLLLFLIAGRRTRLRDRILVQVSTGSPNLGSVTALVRRVALFTLIVEGLGAVALMSGFLAQGLDPVRSAWWGVFHAVSAFNNAGFDLTGDFAGFTLYAQAPVVLLALSALFVLGSLGFAIVSDVASKREWARLALETKVVVPTTVALLAIGAIVIGLLEWSNPATLGTMGPGDRVVNAVFLSASRTAGFAAVPTNGLLEPALIVLMGLMFIGGASGSTAGGIKVNTFSVLLVAIVSTARGDPSATAFGRRIPHSIVYQAIAVALLSIAAVFGVALGLEILSEVRFLELAFEAISALGTVGLSTGITPEMPDVARLLLAVAMFAGRLGPLTLVIALTARARPVPFRPAVETMRIG